MPDDKIVQQAVEQTVQVVPKKEQSPGIISYSVYGTITRGNILPAWGLRSRERYLRDYDRQELNTLWRGARSGIIKKVQSSPWEVKGPKSGVQYFQDLLRSADFGGGWDNLIMLVLRDYLRHDIGAFIEVIGPGDPNGPMTGRITGLAHLDALHCFPTGVPEYPVIYWPHSGNRHWMHKTRVMRFVDMLDGDDRLLGVIGESALSRAIAVVQRELLANRYVAQRLDDKPKPGILLVGNASKDVVEAALRNYREQKASDSASPLGDTIVISSLAQEQPVSVEQISFSEAPEKFDFKQYKVDIDVNELALAIGVDVQELWQLSGGNIGSGTQSAVLHSKSRGKTFGVILKMLERAINDVLPPAYEFQFKYRDSQDDSEQAQTAQTWAGVANQIASYLTPDEIRRLLANKVAAVQDVITDEDGMIARLDDADPVEEAVVPDIGTSPEAAETPEDEALVDDKALKEFEDTRSEFVAVVMDTITTA